MAILFKNRGETGEIEGLKGGRESTKVSLTPELPMFELMRCAEK